MDGVPTGWEVWSPYYPWREFLPHLRPHRKKKSAFGTPNGTIVMESALTDNWHVKIKTLIKKMKVVCLSWQAHKKNEKIMHSLLRFFSIFYILFLLDCWDGSPVLGFYWILREFRWTNTQNYCEQYVHQLEWISSHFWRTMWLWFSFQNIAINLSICE
jgi:hypothetical protein